MNRGVLEILVVFVGDLFLCGHFLFILAHNFPILDVPTNSARSFVCLEDIHSFLHPLDRLFVVHAFLIVGQLVVLEALFLLNRKLFMTFLLLENLFLQPQIFFLLFFRLPLSNIGRLISFKLVVDLVVGVNGLHCHLFIVVEDVVETTFHEGGHVFALFILDYYF